MPIISLSKNTPMADLIAPVMRKSDAEVMHKHAPWESKKSMAFFRCVVFGGYRIPEPEPMRQS